MAYWIGYLIDDYNHREPVPIAAARNKHECMAITARRALVNVCINDSITVQEKDLTEDEFNKAQSIIESYFTNDQVGPGPALAIVRE